MDSNGKKTFHLGATIANIQGIEYRKIYVLRFDLQENGTFSTTISINGISPGLRED
jgi:hypothetical protein